MPCLALAYHRPSTGLLVGARFRTFTALEAALVNAGPGSTGALYDSTKTSAIGTWKYDGVDAFLISRLDLTAADGSEFVAGVDYVLHDQLDLSVQFIKGSGLKVGGAGGISWPALGIADGFPTFTVEADVVWTFGTETNLQHFAAGSFSPAWNLGDGWGIFGGLYRHTNSIWYHAVGLGHPANVVPAVFANSVFQVVTPQEHRCGIAAQGTLKGADNGSYNVFGLRTNTAETGPQTRVFTGSISQAARHAETDHRPCLVFKDSGDASTFVHVKSIHRLPTRAAA